MPPDSFLPNEYVEHQRDRRTSWVALILFLIVVGSIGAAFLYRNSVMHAALDHQTKVMHRYEQAADQVTTLTSLQIARDEMLWRSTLAAALVERVPRSLLMAQVIDCMPEQLGLTEFPLHSSLVRPPPPKSTATQGRPPRRATREASHGSNTPPVTVPLYVARLRLKGVAPTDLHVSRFLSALNTNALIQNVRLESTKEDLLEDEIVRRFHITCSIHPGAIAEDTAPAASHEETFTATAETGGKR